MAQLLVRDLPDDVKKRLKKRAEDHGRSLEAEVRAILSEASAIQPATKLPDREALGTKLARLQAENPIPAEVWEEFDRNIAELRGSWKMRDVDFGK